VGPSDPLAFMDMDNLRDGTDEGGTLTVALVDFVEGSGARMAALMDRSGALLAQSGPGSVASMSDLASLAAGIHAAGRRMSEITRSGVVEEMVALGGAGRVMVREMPASRRSLLLVSVFDTSAVGPGVGPAVRALEGALTNGSPIPGPDPDLESSLIDRLDRTFPAE
jgi:predicted regulator of Ras-like GTPase activity (Roadblock/LC7/MglB family)